MTQRVARSDDLDERALVPLKRIKNISGRKTANRCDSLKNKRNTRNKPHTTDTYESCHCYSDYILDNLRNLIADDAFTDVIFIVEGEEFGCIRSLFGCQSIVFRQMLYGLMMESKPENDVILHDITVEAFKYLRNTFYNIFDNELTAEICVDVLFAAKKYLISPLVSKCMDFIKSITILDDWYFVLRKFETAHSKFISEIVNNDACPYILQYKSSKFIEDPRFHSLKYETIMILIESDNLAATEDDIWEALLSWTRCTANNSKMNDRNERIEGLDMDEKGHSENEICLSDSEKALMNGFIKYVRFNQMSSNYLKSNIVEKRVLNQSDIINIMFARENSLKWQSTFNDSPRIKPKAMDTFQLSEVCLSLKEIQALIVGDLVDFRDIYGLFCSASIVDIDHSQSKVKIHYNSWGSTYDEWYNYISEHTSESETEHNIVGSDGKIAIVQRDKNHRIARFGAITNRKIQRQYFQTRVEQFTDNGNNSNNECQVKLTNWFWKKNQNYIENKHLYINKWLNAKIIGYKTAAKYSQHIKIGIYINDEHFEYWLHPDNDQEVRPIQSVA